MQLLQEASEFSRAGPGGGRPAIGLRLAFECCVSLRSLGFFFFFPLPPAIKHGDGVARLVNKFMKTKAANGACFLTYLNLLGASEAI